MNPQIASKIMSEVPEMQAFLVFLRSEVKKLDTTTDIKNEDPMAIAVEVKARQRATEILVGILSPLLNTQEVNKASKGDYSVDV